jgi:hypothetical protein
MFLFSKKSSRFRGPPGLLFDVYRRPFRRGLGGRGVQLTDYLHLMSRLRMSGDMLLLPPYSYTHRDSLTLDCKINSNFNFTEHFGAAVRLRVRISSGTVVMPYGMFHGFLQSLEANTGTVLVVGHDRFVL